MIGDLVTSRKCDSETIASPFIKALFNAGLQKAVFTYENRYILYFIEALK
jgi:hypothetical protein